MTSAAAAFLVAAVVSMAVGARVIRVLAGLKLRQTISEDAPERHREKQGTPTMGGLIILIGAAVGVAVCRMTDPRVWAVVLMTLAFAALGFVDDYLIALRGKSLGLKARQKLLVQFLIAIGFVLWVNANRAVYPTVLPLWGDRTIDLAWLYYPFAVLLVVGMSNAVNLADGLDGLVAGLVTIAASTLGALVLGAHGANLGLVILAWALAGGCLGFLWYNCNPARVFMGDIGSLALGAALAGIAIAGRREFLFLIVGAIFAIEALSVMIQVVSFKTTRRRVFKMTPIHHHFELSGWAEQKIVTRLWILQGLISLAALAWVGVLRLWD
ncbi:MAG TPA: phospho-N-acetylmuramoyl-pentapeptide-transferase [Armatimonadota bacterium]|nr:phospho-N-acetylmuramoyl-pentapeptide-transferase [Armatimonadota bacterium]